MSRSCTPHLRVLLTSCLLLMLPVSSAFSENSENNRGADLLVEDYELIVDFTLGRRVLTGNVFIYTPPEATLIPLQPLINALEFPIETDPIGLTASGWFLKENNRFDLDVQHGLLILGDRKVTIPRNSPIFSDGFDLFVDINLLQQWFPIKLKLDMANLRLTITSTEKLPFEEQYERRKKREQLLHRKKTSELPLVPDRYEWFGLPTIDLSGGGQYGDTEGGFYSLRGSADMLGFASNFSVNRASTNEGTKSLFRLTKRPNTPDDSLPTGVEEIALGDIYAATDGLIFDGGEGVGINLLYGNQNQYSGNFGTTIIEGESTPGWEVELYKNGVLVEFQTVDGSGRYRFDDVAVEFGENIFDIRIYGSQGQQENRRKSVRVGENMIPVGDYAAQVNYVDVGRALFNDYENIKENDKLYMQWQYGLLDWLAVGSSFAHKKIEEADEGTSYVGLSAMGAFPYLALGVNTAFNDENGWASGITGQTAIEDTSISFVHKHYEDFISDRNLSGNLSDEVEMRLLGFIRRENKSSLSYSFKLSHNVFEKSNDVTEFENRIGLQAFAGSLTIKTALNHSEGSENRYRGEMNYTTSLFRKFTLRTAVLYDLSPETNLNNLISSLSWQPSQRIRASAGVNISLLKDTDNTFDLSASALFDYFTLSLTSNFTDGGHQSVSLSIETSLAAESAGRWEMTGRSQSNNGRVVMQTFIDNDSDGAYTLGDAVVPNVEFVGRRDWYEKRTDETGQVYLGNLSDNDTTPVTIDEGSISDPYWKTQFNQVRVVSHAGAVNHINVPIFVTVEMEGSLQIERSGRTKSAGGVEVRLSTPEGARVATVVTEFDGYYIFEGIPPGQYVITFDPQGLQHYQVEAPQPIAVKAGRYQGIVYIDPVILLAE